MGHATLTVVWSLLAIAGVAGVNADETEGRWSRWRGRDAAGQGGDASFPVAWSADAWAWKADLPGVGHASPVVWEDHVYTASADEPAEVRYLLCHDLTTGRRLWSREILGPIDRHHAQNSSASGSVAADAHGIYWLWGTRENVRLEAVSHEGQPRWHVDLGPFAAEHGFGGTPTVRGDLVIVPLEQDGPGFVIGIDAVTGTERWRLPREGVDKAAYSTPLVIEGADTAAVICTSHGHGLYAIDPKSGRVLWENRCFPRRTVSSPIQAAGLLIGTSGDGEIVVITDGDSFEVLGRTPLGEETRATPAVAGGRLLFRSASHLWALPIVEHTTTREADG